MQPATGIIVCAECGQEFYVHGLVVGSTPADGKFEVDIVLSEQDKQTLMLHPFECPGKKE